MSAAARSAILLGLALAACSQGAGDQANNAAVTDIEALPPDESAATPSDDLANGAVDPSNSDNAQY